MLRFSPVLLLLLASGEAGLFAAASVDTPIAKGAQVGFSYENEQLQPGKYIFVVHEDGSGTFHSEPGSAIVADTSSYRPLAQPLDRTIQLSPAIAQKIFSLARGQKFFAIACEDAKNKVAFQGTKRLSYQGPDGSGACVYNWSKFVPIQKLTAIFESIAFTLEEGRRLAIEQKHDRLSLDAELQTLLLAARDGRAFELPMIEPDLQAIIDDETVMDRARTRARQLLDTANNTALLH